MQGDRRKIKLGEIADIVLGGTPSTAIGMYWIPEINWVTAKDISDSPTAKIIDTERKISKKGLENSPAKILPALTTVIIARGATMGKCKMIGNEMSLNQTCYGIIAKNGTDPVFLYYYLCSMYEHFRAMAHGSVFDTVISSGLRSLEVIFPPLPEQRDDKIDLNRRMNETLESIASALFKSWFIDFDPVRAKVEGHDTGLPSHIADLFPDLLIGLEMGEIPGGWKIGKFGDIAENPRRGINPCEIDPTTPYIALEHMPRRSIALSEWETAEGIESNKFEFKEGEILFGKLRPYFHKVGVAPVNGVCSTDIVVVTPQEKNMFGFVLGNISSDVFVEFTNAGSTGTKMPRTSWDEMARYPIVIPSSSVASAFTEQIRPLVSHMFVSIHQSRTLKLIRDNLLPRLISGRLRVSDTESLLGSYAR
jgi:type I restriction enzyme, S subunit